MKCRCGTNVILSDDWEGHPQYLELVTREPHRCPHNPMFAPKFESNYGLNKADFNPNNEILCREHGLVKTNNQCPNKTCKSRDWIKRGYYNELKEKGLL